MSAPASPPNALGEFPRALRAALLAHPKRGTADRDPPAGITRAFRLIEAGVTILLDAGFSPQDAADGTDCTARLVIGHVLAEAGQPPANAPGQAEERHEYAQRALSPGAFPGLAAVTKAKATHDPSRLFELALRGNQLALAAQLTQPPDTGASHEPQPPDPAR
jgi:hypothetical protein